MELLTDNEKNDGLHHPEANSLASLTDGRVESEFLSNYPPRAWVQIVVELFYLVFILVGSIYFLIEISRTILMKNELVFWSWNFGVYPENKSLLIWIVMGIAALCGGAASSLKWLYHTVAKKRWHVDRVIWRFVVPLLSSVLSVFTGMMVSTGLLPPIFSQTAFENLVFCAGFGFFLGFFSDNLLAWLTNKAYKVFGVVNSKSN